MDLSTAFDSITHDLLIAKMHVYSFSKNSPVFFYSYIKRRKQDVKINNTHGIFPNLTFSCTSKIYTKADFTNDLSFGYQILNY